MTTRVIVVRHGETEWNAAARIQGHLDSELTAEGREQARAIAARLARERVDALVSSDLGRAAETARTIAQRCHRACAYRCKAAGMPSVFASARTFARPCASSMAIPAPCAK